MPNREALALTLDDIDWKAGKVSVERAVVRVGTQRLESDPKTEDGIRTMTVPEFALRALRHQRQHAVGGYFFRTKEGNVPWTSDVQKRLKEACLRAGVPEVSSHMLWKTHASLAIAGGVDVKTVQRRLGHATLALTLGLYAEAMEMGDVKAAQALDTLLGHDSAPALSTDEEAADD